MKHEVPRRIVL